MGLVAKKDEYISKGVGSKLEDILPSTSLQKNVLETKDMIMNKDRVVSGESDSEGEWLSEGVETGEDVLDIIDRRCLSQSVASQMGISKKRRVGRPTSKKRRMMPWRRAS